MKIFYLTESMKWSGGAEQLLMMARALQDRGHSLVLGCQPDSDMSQRAQKAGVAIEWVRMRQDYDVPAAMRLTGILNRHRVDLLHAHHSTAHAIGLMAATWSKVPVFVVTRRVIFPIKTNFFSRLKYRSSRIDGYIAISNAVQQELLKAKIAPSRIQVIPSVIRKVTISREEGMALRAELGIPWDVLLVGSVGNYASFKGQEYLVRAAADVVKHHPKTHFLLVGRGIHQLKSLVIQLGLTHSVHLEEFRTDVTRVLGALDMFVIPSLQEAAGTALREAMSAGLPVVGTQVGGIPDSISNERTGLLIPPADSQSMANAITRMLMEPRWARGLAEEGQKWVHEHFSLDRVVVDMELFYQRLLQGKREKDRALNVLPAEEAR